MGMVLYALLFVMPVLQILMVLIGVLNPQMWLLLTVGLIVSHLFQMRGAKWVVQLNTGFSLYRIKNKRLYWFLGIGVVFLFAFLLNSLGIRTDVFGFSFYVLLTTLFLVMLSTSKKVPQFLYLNETALGYFLKLGQIEYMELKEVEITEQELKVITPFDQIDMIIKKEDFYNAESFHLFIEELAAKRKQHLERIKN